MKKSQKKLKQIKDIIQIAILINLAACFISLAVYFVNLSLYTVPLFGAIILSVTYASILVYERSK